MNKEKIEITSFINLSFLTFSWRERAIPVPLRQHTIRKGKHEDKKNSQDNSRIHFYPNQQQMLLKTGSTAVKVS